MTAMKQTLKSSRMHSKQLLVPVISNQTQTQEQTRDAHNEEDSSSSSSSSNENHSSLTSVIYQGRDVTPSYYDQETSTRVVRFEDTTHKPSSSSTIRENGAPPLVSLLTLDICAELWYQPSELAAFKENIRTILRNGGPEKDAGFVGDLERCSRDRRISKRRAIQFVLGAQKLQKGADFLGMMSRKSSFWVCDIALTRGWINVCEVNDPCSTRCDHNDFFFCHHCILKKRKQTSTSLLVDSTMPHPLSAGIYGERRVLQRTTVGNKTA